MRIIGCDLHARQQTIAMLDSDTGELEEKTLEHQGETVREFYSALPGPILVGIEATGSMQWFLELMEELGIECRVGHPQKIRKAETRKQKHDRRDARLLLTLLAENRFPTIWMPSSEQRDLRTLLRHRHQWVRLRSRVQHTLQSMALNHGLRRGRSLWSQAGQDELRALPLAPHASERRKALLTLYPGLQESIDQLDHEVSQQVQQHPLARRLMTHPGVGPITALATEVFLGDPMRFSDGKALASYNTIPARMNDEARQSDQKHSVAVRQAVEFVKQNYPGLRISETAVRRILAEWRPRKSGTILRVERSIMTEEEISKYRSIREQAAAFQQEKGLKVPLPPDIYKPSKTVTKFVFRFGERPDYPRSNRKTTKD